MTTGAVLSTIGVHSRAAIESAGARHRRASREEQPPACTRHFGHRRAFLAWASSEVLHPCHNRFAGIYFWSYHHPCEEGGQYDQGPFAEIAG